MLDSSGINFVAFFYAHSSLSMFVFLLGDHMLTFADDDDDADAERIGKEAVRVPGPGAVV